MSCFLHSLRSYNRISAGFTCNFPFGDYIYLLLYKVGRHETVSGFYIFSFALANFYFIKEQYLPNVNNETQTLAVNNYSKTLDYRATYYFI